MKKSVPKIQRLTLLTSVGPPPAARIPPPNPPSWFNDYDAEVAEQEQAIAALLRENGFQEEIIPKIINIIDPGNGINDEEFLEIIGRFKEAGKSTKKKKSCHQQDSR